MFDAPGCPIVSSGPGHVPCFRSGRHPVHGGGAFTTAPMHHPVQTISEAPLVSIIVPVYNLETCVSSCLDSLLRQT